MFERVLPETVKPFKLARQNARLVGLVPLPAFENLASGLDLTIPHDDVKVDVRFESGPGGVALLSGQLSATIPYQCQRCLEPVTVDVSASVQLAVFDQDIDEDTLPEGYEPVQVESEQVRLVELIEQELILAAPIVPAHEQCEWVAVPEAQDPVEEVGEETSPRENPFAGLSELLAKGRQPGKK